jgi:hypothetical protein
MKINREHLETVKKILKKEILSLENIIEIDVKNKKKVKEFKYCVSFVDNLFMEYEKSKSQSTLF